MFEIDERTVADWLQRGGMYSEAFHHQHIRKVNLEQVDELRLKMQGKVLWIALSMAVGSRLWLGAVGSLSRDKQLARQMITCVYKWARQLPLVISFDGWSAYPKACRRLFREPLLTGRVGGVRQQAWSCLSVVQVVKRQGQRWVFRRWVLSGSCSMARYLLNVTQGVGTTINTAYIERLNATFRAHLASMARRTRCPARQVHSVAERVFLIGCMYNFCWLHAAFNKPTPAMATGLTDHCWSLDEFLWTRLLPHWASTA